jgi:hypothetical protein
MSYFRVSAILGTRTESPSGCGLPHANSQLLTNDNLNGRHRTQVPPGPENEGLAVHPRSPPPVSEDRERLYANYEERWWIR